jgi:nitric oxide reductase FlRd-NAD(+) reductase
MSDGIVIIGSGFAARQLVKNIRKQDAKSADPDRRRQHG